MIDTVILDAGHGGIDAKGRYTTAPAKMFKHNEKEIAYEGVINRELSAYISMFLSNQGIKVHYTVSLDDPIDLSLKKRIEIVNNLPKENTLLLSIHSNSSPNHKARGFEIFTSKGITKSDAIATAIGESIKNKFKTLRFRKDTTDGDLDKEADFYVLRKSKCAAVLLENLFFDNYADFKLLSSSSFLMSLAWYICQGIFNYNKK